MPSERPTIRCRGLPKRRISGSRRSDGITDCKRRVADFARREGPILVTGEAGTGKALFARVIHDLSPGHEGPFVSVDCGSVDGDRLAATLLGREEGGVPGGAFAEAAGGTLYLATLAEAPLEVQSRLLAAVAATSESVSTVRLIAGVAEDVDAAVARGGLRQDLLSALRVQWLDLPPLRARTEDIPLLITAFQREHGAASTGGVAGFTVDALEAMTSYRWPGNVRELRHEVLRVLTSLDEGELVEVRHLSPRITEALAAEAVPPPDLEVLAARPLVDAREDFERWRIRRALHDCGGNQSLAAQRLGLSRAGLFKKMRRLNVADDRKR